MRYNLFQQLSYIQYTIHKKIGDMPEYTKLKKMQKIYSLFSKCIQIQKPNSPEYALQAMLHLDSNFSHAYFIYSLYLREKPEPDLRKSQIYLEEAIKLNPYFYGDQDRSEQSKCEFITKHLPQLQKLLKQQTFIPTRFFQQLTLFSKHKDLNTCSLLLTLYPSSPTSTSTAQHLSTLGLLHYQVGNYELSTSFYLQAVQKKPGQYKYFNNLAFLACIERDVGKAEQYIRSSLEIKPGYGKSWFLMGIVLGMRGDVEGAIEKLLMAIADTPSSTMFNLQLLLTHLHLHLHNPNLPLSPTATQSLLTILNQHLDKDTYFPTKQNLSTIQLFLKAVQQIYPNLQGNKQQLKIWEDTVHCMEMFLLKGHIDKWKIRGRVRQNLGNLRHWVEASSRNKQRQQREQREQRERNLMEHTEQDRSKENNNESVEMSMQKTAGIEQILEQQVTTQNTTELQTTSQSIPSL